MMDIVLQRTTAWRERACKLFYSLNHGFPTGPLGRRRREEDPAEGHRMAPNPNSNLREKSRRGKLRLQWIVLALRALYTDQFVQTWILNCVGRLMHKRLGILYWPWIEWQRQLLVESRFWRMSAWPCIWWESWLWFELLLALSILKL